MTPDLAPPQLRLLLLLPFAPRLDATSGGSRAVALRIAGLAARHTVALLYLREHGEPPIDDALREHCDLVAEVWRPSGLGSLVRSPRILASVLRGRPLWCAFTSVEEYSERVREIARDWRPDLVQIEFHVMGQYLPALSECRAPRVLTEHEPGFAAARDLWRSRPWPLRPAGYVATGAWKRFEREVIDKVDSVVVFTERDRLEIARLAPAADVVRIPLGTPLPARQPSTAGAPRLVFVGNFKHGPNLDAALRLALEIFPRVRERVPAAQLTIVGDGAPRRLARRAGRGVSLAGRVPDVTPFLDEAALVVVPLRLGGGMRVKVLEALAVGKAIVASPRAAEGLDLVDGEHVLFAETDEQFVDAIVRLIGDAVFREQLAANARAWACEYLRMERSITEYEALYAGLTGARDARQRNQMRPRRSEAPIAEVTVAVSTLGRPAALARCLDALLAGDVLPREILVVDQSDAEEGRAIVERAVPAGIALRYVHHAGRGLSASRNVAIACASQPIVAVTDDDCVPSASWVAAIERSFSSPDSPDAVSGRVLPLGPDAPGLYAASTRSSERRALYTGRVEPWYVGTGGNFAFRRDLIARVGLYDERLGAGSPGRAAEDMDLFYRITTAGARVLYDPESVVYHERKSWERLLESDEGYGRGIGAFCAIWTRRSHAYALYILVLWLGHHLKRLVASAARRDWGVARDALGTLRGTAGGVRYGLGVREQR